MMACRGHRGVTIIAILLVITIGALVASTMIHATDAQHALAEASVRRTQSRALAWSGVQAVMAELSSQRDDLLDGSEPRLTGEWELFTLDDGRRGVVRLLPVGRTDELFESEAGKLNVNTATTEMLASVPGLDETLAEAVVAARENGPIQSIEGMTSIDGITPEMVFGGAAGGSADEAGPSTALIHLLTAHSADPNVQVGEGDNGTSFRGDRRINVNMAWSERLGKAITRRYDEEFAAGVKNVMESDAELTSEGQFVRLMRQFNNEPSEWVQVLDVFCATPDPYTLGRVDLLRAPVEVLGALPGIDESTAQAIVDARGGLDSESRRTVVWPVIAGVMTPDQFQESVDLLSSRSMQWRVRVEAGIARDEDEARVSVDQDRGSRRTDVIGGSFRGADEGMLGDRSKLDDRIVLDVVIDVASMRPRVAYLRDVTYQDTAFELRRSLESLSDESPDEGESRSEQADEVDGAAVAPADEMDEPEADEDEWRLGRVDRFDPFEEEAEAPSEVVEPSRADMDRTDSTENSAEQDEADEGVDRRIGRWAARGGGS